MGILRRLHTTPLRVWQYFLSVMLGNAVVGLMSLGVDVRRGHSYLQPARSSAITSSLALFLALGLITILGIGLAIGGWAKNERQAAPLGQHHRLPDDVPNRHVLPALPDATLAAEHHDLYATHPSH